MQLEIHALNIELAWQSYRRTVKIGLTSELNDTTLLVRPYFVVMPDTVCVLI